MSPPPYMRLYIADYLGDTTHLSTEEHGAYLLLLMSAWRSGGRLPLDDVMLAKLVKLPPRSWAKIKPNVMAFFQRRGSSYTHKRIAKELEVYTAKIARLQEAGKRGALVSNEKSKASGAANAGKKSGKSRHNQNQNQRRVEGGIDTPSTLRREDADERADGSSPPRSVIDFEELRERIFREAEEMAAAWRMA